MSLAHTKKSKAIGCEFSNKKFAFIIFTIGFDFKFKWSQASDNFMLSARSLTENNCLCTARIFQL
jgi:hypothetical protein